MLIIFNTKRSFWISSLPICKFVYDLSSEHNGFSTPKGCDSGTPGRVLVYGQNIIGM